MSEPGPCRGPREEVRLTVGTGGLGQRLDVFVADALAQRELPVPVTRSGAQKLIRAGDVAVDGVDGVDGKIVLRPSFRVEPGQIIKVVLPGPEPSNARPEPIDLDVVYEDAYLLAVNKPRGMVVHPAAGHRSGTLVNAVLAHCPELRGDPDPLRPGIVHRLDRDTTGLILVAKDPATRLVLGEMIRRRQLHRTYLALVWGHMPAAQGEIAGNIARSTRDRKRMAVVPSGGREALTRWRRIAALDGFELLEIKPHTGRTHQIRVHMAHAGRPVAFDPVYGFRNEGPIPADLRLAGQALHAWKLSLVHPRTGTPLDLVAALPGDVAGLLRWLYGRSGLPASEWLGG